MVNCEIADRVTSLMNELLALDPDAVCRIVETRVQCGDRVAGHPHVQVSSDNGNPPYMLGIMGILNGIIGADGKRFVIANLDENGRVVGFSHTVKDHDDE